MKIGISYSNMLSPSNRYCNYTYTFGGESMKVQEVQKKTQDEEKVRDEENIGCALSVVMLFLAIVAMASIVSGIVMLTEALWN